jgi:uracil-DNA glycosylase
MLPPPISGSLKKRTKIISIGQAPGIHEKEKMMPFSYTAGKTLFRWFESIGIKEDEYRKKINMSAVCRCFPGKAKTGDRKPDKTEVEKCSRYLRYEILYHKPELIIPIGKLAIDQIINEKNYKLDSIIGKKLTAELCGHSFDWIALPHPSGLNVWNNTEIGKRLTSEALQQLLHHRTIIETFF